tara:strand:+ start:3015 stop:4082 length:1068 start_codon:yes stop_codon:yes gene_type:complete
MKLLTNFSLEWFPTSCESVVEALVALGYNVHPEIRKDTITKATAYKCIGSGKDGTGGLVSLSLLGHVDRKSHYSNYRHFLKAHNELNKPTKKDFYTGEDFPKDLISFEDFMEVLYSGKIGDIRDNLYIDVNCEDNSYENNICRVYTGVLEYLNKSWLFEIVDGNLNGTDVKYFDALVDNEFKDKYYSYSKVETPKELMHKYDYSDKKIEEEEGSMSREFKGSNSVGNYKSEELALKTYTGMKFLNNPVGGNLCNETILTKGESKMTERKTVVVELFDDSKGILAENSKVFGVDLVTDLTKEQVIHKVLMEEDVAASISLHNDMREGCVNEDILERTGNKVFLKEVRLKDLRWVVR